MQTILSLCIFVLFGGGVSAQPERYELGQRLKAFEKQWDKTTDAKLKKKAAETLPKLTPLFLTGQFGEAGRTLDQARWILEGKEPSDDEKWAQSLYAVPWSRYVVGPSPQLEVTIDLFYPLKTERPKNLRVELMIPALSMIAAKAIDELPKKINLLNADKTAKYRRGGDYSLEFTVSLGEHLVAKKEITVSYDELDKRDAESMEKQFANAKKVLKEGSLEWATAKDRANLLRELAKGEVFETDIPAWWLRQEVLTFQYELQFKRDYFTPNRPGQFWLSIPVSKTTVPARLFVPRGRRFIPEGETAVQPIPIVVALHGAGGSENLFFEGYGDGQIARLCEKRGWYLLAPRCEFFGGPPIGEIVDELAKRYPIDSKAIFVVGHSLGAMQAIDAVQKYPGKFAGVAAFGGGGKIRKPEAFAALPTYIAVGDKDFALGQAQALKKTLLDAKAKAVTYKEYEGLEHLLICREALPDAFEMFDKVLKK